MKAYIIACFLIVGAFVLGFLTGPKPDPEVENRFIQERAIWQQQIEQKEARIKALTGLQDEIRKKAVSDSIRFAGLLRSKEIRITHLTKKINALDFKSATTEQLDSVSAALYGSESLHTRRD